MTQTTWLTTTRFEDRFSLDGRSPWGVRHAKREGSRQTACGVQAVGWKLFWHLPFRPVDSEACPSCREAVVFIEASENASLAKKSPPTPKNVATA